MSKAAKMWESQQTEIKAAIGPTAAILTIPTGAAPPRDTSQDEERDRNTRWIPLDKIEADEEQPRQTVDLDTIAQLAESLKRDGQLQACRAVETSPGRYKIVSGERRLRAARAAGIPRLKCEIIAAYQNDADKLCAQLIENIARENLPPLDLARAYVRLRDEFQMHQHQIAARLGTSQATVSKTIELLDLPSAMQRMVETEKLAPSTALAIARVKEPEAQQELARRAVKTGMTRKQAEAEAKAIQSPPTEQHDSPSESHPTAKFTVNGEHGPATNDPVGPYAKRPHNPTTFALQNPSSKTAHEPAGQGGQATASRTAPHARDEPMGTVWGCDFENHVTVTVTLPFGVHKDAIRIALHDARARWIAEAAGLTKTHPIKAHARVTDPRRRSLHGRIGVITGYTHDGQVEGRFDTETGKMDLVFPPENLHVVAIPAR